MALKFSSTQVYRRLHYKRLVFEEIVRKDYSQVAWEKVLDLLNNDEDADGNIDFEELFGEIDSSKNRYLSKNNVTRWSSTLSMLKSFLNLFDAINDVLYKEKSHELFLKDDEKVIIKDLVSIFEIFENAVKVLQVSIFIHNF